MAGKWAELTRQAGQGRGLRGLFALDVIRHRARIGFVSNDNQFSICLTLNHSKAEGKLPPVMEELVFLTNPRQLP